MSKPSVTDRGQSPASRTRLFLGLHNSFRRALLDTAPLLVQPSECLGVRMSVEELMSPYVNFWQRINALDKRTNVWFSDPRGEGKKTTPENTPETER